mmetsp:Transcript_34772/g.97069  ORF Transcript_34772/g.97069 Transcript_34772/m.97069 type:complete len:239 (-) Transcript_34772:247-963(-)
MRAHSLGGPRAPCAPPQNGGGANEPIGAWPGGSAWTMESATRRVVRPSVRAATDRADGNTRDAAESAMTSATRTASWGDFVASARSCPMSLAMAPKASTAAPEATDSAATAANSARDLSTATSSVVRSGTAVPPTNSSTSRRRTSAVLAASFTTTSLSSLASRTCINTFLSFSATDARSLTPSSEPERTIATRRPRMNAAICSGSGTAGPRRELVPDRTLTSTWRASSLSERSTQEAT